MDDERQHLRRDESAPQRGPASEEEAASEVALRAVLARQREAFLREGAPPYAVRIDRIDRAIALLLRYQRELCEVLAADFGHRSHDQTLLTDIMTSVRTLRFARRSLRRWMRPEQRAVDFPLGLLGGRARVEYQPKGVVGVISPWNFPVNLTFTPLAGILAAGNRVMIKPSELSPATSALLQRMFREAYDESEIAVFIGGPATGAAFCRLPLDHLLFTGSTTVGREVMRAAAENLVPVTLELGGKSPAIVSRSADLAEAAARIMAGKTLNAGQLCLAPDYVLAPEDRIEDFVAQAQAAVGRMFPTLRDNPDYTSIINRRHYERLQSYLADARDKGARVVEINPAGEDFSRQAAHKLPPTLILDATEGMRVLQEEIFGPLLPILPYRSIAEAISYVNAHDRPLGLYYFGTDEAEEALVLGRTHAGGVTVNDVLLHAAVENLPFGGIGPSGMGRYHGIDGFREFSHAKAIYTQSKLRMVTELLRPPFGERTRRAISLFMKF